MGWPSTGPLPALSFFLLSFLLVPSNVCQAGDYVHPGIIVSRAQLDAIRADVHAKREPTYSAFLTARHGRVMAGCKRTAYHWCNVSGRYPPGCNQTANPFCNVSLGSLDYTPHPNRSIEGNTIVAWPEKEDSAAAYTHALLWYITQDERHAAKSIEIMDAWSTTFRHQSDSSGKSAGLVAGWTGAVWPRAAEIIKHTTPPSLWHATSVARFERMLNTVYLPLVNRGSDTNGNWGLAMTEAAFHIGVFTDNATTVDRALQLWRAQAPAYLYHAPS